MSDTRSKWSQMPRATRWGVMALVGLVLYFGVFEQWLGAIQSLSSKASAKTAELANLSGRAGSIEAAKASMLQGLARYGEGTLPGDAAAGSIALNKRLEAVLQEHSVKGATTTARTASLNAGPLNPAGSTTRLDRLVAELQFESSPETASAVLAALERVPEVSSVSRVEWRKQGGAKSDRQVRVTMSVEAWIRSAREARGAAGSSAGIGGVGGLP